MTTPEQPEPDSSTRLPALAIVRRILQIPLTILVLLYFLFDDLVLSWLRPVFAWAGRLNLFVRIAAWMHGLGPYQSLLLFAVPFIALEPFKIGGLVLLGIGQFKAGVVMLAFAHIASLLILERIFHVTRDKLLSIWWFAKGFHWVMAIKDWAFSRLRQSYAWRAMVALMARIRPGLAPIIGAARALGRTVVAAATWVLRHLRTAAQR